MTRIGLIIGSTRPHRRGEDVARWALDLAQQRGDASFDLIDLRDHDLPHYDEPLPPVTGRYQHAHTRRWAERIGSFDGFVIVTPEYNHSAPGVLTDALAYLYAEWANKAVGFVSYGGHGGVRAVEHLRAIAGELNMADVRAQVALSFATDFEHHRVLKPAPHQTRVLHTMLDQVIAWTNALSPMRQVATVTHPPVALLEVSTR